uniref:DUF481 domain-containing protein n=1 Tax=Ningiella ruwaisensis TaxID=2364274 RepID=UPI001444A182|nr:DUF481 domain-containing protein [Ningiella ruwaisensis]
MSVSAFADADFDAISQQKASDFFSNPSAKRNLLRLLNTDLEYSEDEMEEDIPSFELDGEVGILATTGNTETSMVKLALEANHELEDWSNTYFLQVLSRTTKLDDDEIEDLETNRFHLYSQLDYKLRDPQKRLFIYAEYDDNQFLKLRDQITGVVGWSQVLWQEEHTNFRYSIGPGYTKSEQESTDLNIEEMIIRATANFSYEFENESRFRQSISAEMGEVASRARSNTSISAQIYERLAMKLSFEVAFDENVAQNIENLTTQTSISMVYQFF